MHGCYLGVPMIGSRVPGEAGDAFEAGTLFVSELEFVPALPAKPVVDASLGIVGIATGPGPGGQAVVPVYEPLQRGRPLAPSASLTIGCGPFPVSGRGLT
jgi:hypothetical protein